MEKEFGYPIPERSSAKRVFADIFLVLFIGLGLVEFNLLLGIWTPAWLVTGGIWVGMIVGAWAAMWMWLDTYREFSLGIVIIAVIMTVLAETSVLGYAEVVARGWAFAANICIAIAYVIYLLTDRA